MNISSKLALTLAICLITASLYAQQAADIDLNHLLTEKKALLTETIQFTEQEGKAFWPLYEEYMQTVGNLFKRRIDLEKAMLEHGAALTEKRAKIIVDEYYDIVSTTLKTKLSMLKKIRKILPEVKVLKFFQLEEKIEAGFQSIVAESQPLVK